MSITIAEYLERIVALTNEKPPLWQILPRLAYRYVCQSDGCDIIQEALSIYITIHRNDSDRFWNTHFLDNYPVRKRDPISSVVFGMRSHLNGGNDAILCSIPIKMGQGCYKW